MSGFSDYLSIKDPTKLYELKDEKQKTFCNWYMEVDSIKDKKRQTYAAMIHRLDVNIGRILAELDHQGLRENTLIIFLSDNGGPVDGNASVNVPYRGQKGTLLEGGIHVPFIMNWPGKISGGKVVHNLVPWISRLLLWLMPEV